MAFIKVKNDDFWDPTRVEGTDGKMTERTTPPNENDFIEGWLIGYEENQGKDKNSTIYSIMLKDNSAQKSFWGTMTLNDSLKKVPEGSFVRVKWLGKVKAKQAGGRPYHTWEVAYDPDMGLYGSVTNSGSNISTPATPNNAAQSAPTAGGLPF